jgi:hypothetical protein
MSRISTLAYYIPSLSSLLVIFLVECMSSPTSSAPLTIRYHRPLDRVRGSPSFLPLRTIHTKTRAYVQLAYLSRHYPINFHLSAAQLPPISSPPISPSSQQAPSDSTPLLGSCSSAPSQKPRRHTVVGLDSHDGHSHNLIPGHHRHESHSRHEHHHIDHPRCVVTRFYEATEGEGCASAKVSHGEDLDLQAPEPQRYPVHSHSHGHHGHGHGDLEALLEPADSDAGTDCTAEEEDAERAIGRKRQIVGILVRHTLTST